MIHGQFVTSLYFEETINALSETFTVIAPDLRGFSKSTYNKAIDSFDDYAEDLYLFLKKLNINKMTIMAWSAGGPAAMMLALKYPHLIEGMILVASIGPTGMPRKKQDGTGKFMTTKDDFMNHKDHKGI